MDEIIYGIEPNLTVVCKSKLFRVHREILSQASPVWEVLLNGTFKESTECQLILQEDDEENIKTVFDIIYCGICGTPGILPQVIRSSSSSSSWSISIASKLSVLMNSFLRTRNVGW